MIATIFALVTSLHSPDAYWICGRNPTEQCLVTVDTCLQHWKDSGLSPDEVFEYCAETTDPTLIHWVEPKQ